MRAGAHEVNASIKMEHVHAVSKSVWYALLE
jgi:hypothetical protein